MKAEYFCDVSKKQCEEYCEKLVKEGFLLYEEHCLGENTFYTYVKEEDINFVSYYPKLKEIHVVSEPNSNWLQYSDEVGGDKVSTLLCQVDLEDFGESYVIRLRDGRMIVFDGGFEKESDADALMNKLKEFSNGEKPRIAAWIMTHPHLDHYRCFLVVEEKYGNQIEIEKFIYNFPDADDAEWKSLLALQEDDIYLEKLYWAVERTGAKVYRAHTGQVYHVGNAKMEILSSPDNMLLQPIKSFNQVSLVIRMEIEGQVIIWGGDADFEYAKLDERYGTYLKADFLQIPHHGFPGGHVKTYDFISPSVCLVSSLDWVWLGRKFKFFELNHNQHLIYNMDIKEYFIGGNGDITLELPYEQRESKKAELFAVIEQLRKEKR